MTAGGARILVIDDEPQIRRALQTALTAHNYTVETAENGSLGLATIATWAPDAVVLDLVMPVMDGFEVLRQVRTWSDVPIIVLSARGQEPDKVNALDQGADDYLTKPFGMGELLARLRVILRRQRGAHAATIQAGEVVIDLEHRQVTRAGEAVHLTPTELSLLLALARDAGKVLTHRQVLQRVWGEYAAENSAQLRVYVNYLRRKLEHDPAHPVLIVTEPGVGYRLKIDAADSLPHE
ncbi:MAG: response regulator [Thermomicrobiales bacterium]|nr:response regulator [Chloroflexia bacterium]